MLYSVDVGICLKDIGCLIFLAASSLVAQTALPPTPPPSTAGFFPIEQVHRGLQGVAYTVFEGTQPEPMGVQILGLLHNALGPGQDMILARLEGAKPEYTGVVAGMSGSPVYINGKLLGAISYRIGSFSKEPIAGITPIGQMLEVSHQSTNLIAASHAQSLTGNDTAENAAALPSTSQDTAESNAIRPMDTALVFNGFSPQALELWKQHAPMLGMNAVAGIGGSASNEKQPEPIIPGSAISALLMRGDLEIAATCTVTYVDPRQLLACGHPITQFGPVSMPMTKAQVVATLPSPLNAFKIVNTTETVGSFTEDRESAIRGVFGRRAKMIPVTVNITGEETPSHALHIEVVDQPQITPSAVMVAVFQALMQRNTFTAETSYRVRSTVNVAGFPAVHFGGLAAPSEIAPANLLAALMVGERFSQLYDNAARQTPIDSVNIEVQAIPKHLTAELESAQSTVSIVHPGETVTIEASIRPWRGEVRNIRIPITLPDVLGEGHVRILVSDGSTLDRLTEPPRLNRQGLDVAATIQQLNSLHENDRLYVTLLEPSPQAVLDGRTLATVPMSMANVLEPLRQNQKLMLNGESAVPMASVPIDHVLSGQQVLTLQVE